MCRFYQHRCFDEHGNYNVPLIRGYVLEQLQHVKRHSSPGIPFAVWGSTNGDILDNPEAIEVLVSMVIDRLKWLGARPLDADYSERIELVQKRLVDAVRIFVKQEPHKRSKIDAKRWRLIWSISLVDQVVERFLWSAHTKHEILHWDHIPSKPGMGSSDEQIASLVRQIECLRGPSSSGALCDRDAIASDMELSEWLLFCGLVSCLIEYDYPLDSDFWRTSYSRHRLAVTPVVCLSNGKLFRTELPGLMLSGRFVTSFLNSRVYTFLTSLRGEEGVCMGDDTIETNRTGMNADQIQAFYAMFGLPTEIGLCTNIDGLEFCSMLFRTKPDVTASPVRWARTFYRLLSGFKFRDGEYHVPSEAVEQFKFETRNMVQEWKDKVYPFLARFIRA